MRDQIELPLKELFIVLATAFVLAVAFLTVPSLPAFASAAEMYYSLGQEYMKNGKFDLAALSLKKAVELSPDWPEAHNALGEAYFRLLRFEDARVEFDKAIELKPDYTQAKLNRNRTIRAIERYEPVKGFKLKLWHRLAIVSGIAIAVAAAYLLYSS